MSSIISERFILAVNQLIKENKVKSIRQFCQSINYLPQSISQVIHGQRDVTIDVLRNAIEKYNINPLFLFMGEGSVFIEAEELYNFKTITIVTDRDQNERIVHVPMPAQAGYADGFNNLEMIRDLPSYTLPDITYQTGTYRSFDVKGDSMHPTIEEQEILICSYLEPTLWESAIRDHHVYVIVTHNDVVVKRVINKLRRHKHLELHSDNEAFNMYRVNGNEIREIWFVKSKISKFRHSASPHFQNQHNEDLKAYLQTIQAQADIISTLKLQSNLYQEVKQ